jgi:hypothetical protein
MQRCTRNLHIEESLSANSRASRFGLIFERLLGLSDTRIFIAQDRFRLGAAPGQQVRLFDRFAFPSGVPPALWHDTRRHTRGGKTGNDLTKTIFARLSR